MSLFFNVLYNIYIYKYKNIKNVKNIKHNFLLIIKLIARNLIKKNNLQRTLLFQIWIYT